MRDSLLTSLHCQAQHAAHVYAPFTASLISYALWNRTGTMVNCPMLQTNVIDGCSQHLWQVGEATPLHTLLLLQTNIDKGPMSVAQHCMLL